MILAVDAGNTAVTLGCVEGREILNLARLATSPGRSADEYAVLMERVLSLRGVKLREFEGAAIASVLSYTVAGALFLIYFMRSYSVRAADVFLLRKSEVQRIVKKFKR